jgi:hypothetical protein
MYLPIVGTGSDQRVVRAEDHVLHPTDHRQPDWPTCVVLDSVEQTEDYGDGDED